MKRLIAAGVIAVLLVGLCLFGNRLVCRICESLDRELAACEEAFGTPDFPRVNEAFQQHYVESEGWLSAFVNHGTVEELGLTVARMGACGSVGADTFFAEAAAIRAELCHLKQEETVGWDCLF